MLSSFELPPDMPVQGRKGSSQSAFHHVGSSNFLFAPFIKFDPHELTNAGQPQWRPFMQRSQLRKPTQCVLFATQHLSFTMRAAFDA